MCFNFLPQTNLISSNILFLFLFLYITSIFLICLLLVNGVLSTSNIFVLSKINLVCTKKKTLFLLTVINLAGVPPLGGFFLKFKICIFILLNYNIFYFIIFYSFVLISFFFYLFIFKNSREIFLKKVDMDKLHTSLFEKKIKKYNFFISFLIIFLFFINFFFIFFLKDFFLIWCVL